MKSDQPYSSLIIRRGVLGILKPAFLPYYFHMRSVGFQIIFIFWLSVGYSQHSALKQIIRGRVVDSESARPMGNVHILVDDSADFGNVTDSIGYFQLELPIGRRHLEFRMIGFKSFHIHELPVTVGKQIELVIELEEDPIELKEIVVHSDLTYAKPTNESALISAYSFTVDEIKRIPASISDPARLMMNFPGVSAASDEGNALIVRGNSPRSNIWRLEEIEIPNPNHFGSWGSTGGGISMLNSTLLRTSDFYTGAFPPEIGNSLGGAFDLYYRNGNSSESEYVLQLSTMGIEAAAEGPFRNGSRSSYLINYRYSTLELLKRFISFGDIPAYQDMSLKLNFELNHGRILQVFGLSGFSQSAREAIPDSLLWKNGERNFEFNSRVGTAVVGISYLHPLKKSSYLKTIISGSIESNKDESDTLNHKEAYVKIVTEKTNLISRALRLHTYFNSKINARHTVKIGLLANLLNFEQRYGYIDKDDDLWKEPISVSGATQFFQGYIQTKLKWAKYLTTVGGVHVSYLMLNRTHALEPRLTTRYELKSGSIFLAAGLHSKVEHMSTYFFGHPDLAGNSNLELLKAFHTVVGHEFPIYSNCVLKYELYAQHLWNIPVEPDLESGFSMINVLNGFELINIKQPLSSRGTGRNMGLDIAFQKRITKGHYLMATTSLFKSTYTNFAGRNFSTRFDRRFQTNLVSGKEFYFGTQKEKTLGVNGKINWAGGIRETPIDLDRSRLEGRTVYMTASYFSKQNPSYFRLDASVYYIINKGRITHRIQVDVQNATNHQNVFYSYYDLESESVRTIYQLGPVPNISYRIDF